MSTPLLCLLREPMCVFASGCFVCLPVSHRITDGKYTVHDEKEPFTQPRDSFSWPASGKKDSVNAPWLCKAISCTSPELSESREKKKLLATA